VRGEPTLLHRAVLDHAVLRPDRVAVDEGARVATYGDLARSMNRLAVVLLGVGVRRRDRVGVFLENGIDACVSILGALQSGACYVPLSPSHPAARTALILEDAELSCLVTTRAHLDAALAAMRSTKGAATGALVVLDEDRAEIEARLEGLADVRPRAIAGRGELDRVSESAPESRGEETDPAYILFTSGTTGRPKGVVVSHANVKAYLGWALPYLELGPEDRLSHHSNIAFDMSVFDIFGAFHAGATLCPLMTNAHRVSPADYIRERRITIWFSVPAVLGLMIAAGRLEAGAIGSSLRAAMFAGETLPTEYVQALRRAQPRIQIVNTYGPTETTIACTFHKVGVDSPFEPDRAIPIGRPFPGTEVLILKLDEDRPADVGEVGRLLIAGHQVAVGYWNRPDLTAAAFRRDLDPSGRVIYETGDLAFRDASSILHFAGRRDTQVKVHGYRIELGEVEVAIGRHELVNEVAVVSPERRGERSLVAYVAPLGHVADEALAESAILDHCERLLPPYMVPSEVRFLPRLPRNENGKIDRKRLLAEGAP
jgi:amino acid adenylation domain-containing protein